MSSILKEQNKKKNSTLNMNAMHIFVSREFNVKITFQFYLQKKVKKNAIFKSTKESITDCRIAS